MNLKEFLQQKATPELVDVIRTAIARSEAKKTSTYFVHLADALLDESSTRARTGDELRVRAKAALATQIAGLPSTNGSAGRFDFSISTLVDPAIALARDWGAERVSPLALLTVGLTSGLLMDSESVRTQEALRAAGLTVEGLVPPREADQIARADFTYRSLGFGLDLTAMARAAFWAQSPLVGMERELRRLVMSISSGGDSIVLVGEPGVGKSALVFGLAYHIAHQTRPLIPTVMDSWTIVMISTVNVLAGTGGRGELEERLDHMLTFFRKNPTVIPFFDEIHTLLDTDDASARSVATAIKPPMVSGQFRCLGATTDREYARFIANDEALNSRFTKVLLPEPDEESTIKIIEGVQGNLIPPAMRDIGVTLTKEGLRTAVRMTSRYQRTDRQPRKTIRLLRSVVSEKAYAIRIGADATDGAISAADIASTFSDISGVPVDELTEDRPGFYVRLREHVATKVLGQDPAIDAVTSWLALHSKGWVDPRRPRGRFLFLGPPGVGKTELALALAEEVMRDRGSVIIKNMAEYQGEGARNRFMGADPGYLGFGQTQTLYAQVMMRPYSVIVLDELEKAHPSLGDPLLSLLDGRGEDAQGRGVDFAQCILVLTSNALHSEMGVAGSEESLRRGLLALGDIWQPPLVDRIDRIVLFRALDRDVLLRILDLLIEVRRQRALQPLPTSIDSPEERNIILNWATEGEEVPSARRLERALLRWLSRHSVLASAAGGEA